jgi:hypothetical protein
VDAAASLTSADDVTLQDILETLDVPHRWEEGGGWGACAAGGRGLGGLCSWREGAGGPVQLEVTGSGLC